MQINNPVRYTTAGALLGRLTEIYQRGGGLRVGELALEGVVEQRVVCDLVFDDAWRGALSARHFRNALRKMA